MELYKNLGGDSGIVAYELGLGRIFVKFHGGWIYLYTNQSAGTDAITQMHNLALAGQGLNSYISRSVSKKFESKSR